MYECTYIHIGDFFPGYVDVALIKSAVRSTITTCNRVSRWHIFMPKYGKFWRAVE
jgi:hypothetical protein